MAKRKNINRYAGPCQYCQSCIDEENGICLLLMKEVKRASRKDKCVAYQPKRAGK